jgi:N-acetylmuramoyl-L-alanine amidase
MTRIGFIAVHCSATPATATKIGATDIRLWHRQKGWRDIGYHYVIKRDGTIEKGRPEDQPGAHEPKINSHSIAVCLVGGSPPIGSPEQKRGLGENNYTPEQWASLKKLVSDLSAKHPAAVVLGHRDVPGVNKACPSFDVKAWWKANDPTP